MVPPCCALFLHRFAVNLKYLQFKTTAGSVSTRPHASLGVNPVVIVTRIVLMERSVMPAVPAPVHFVMIVSRPVLAHLKKRYVMGGTIIAIDSSMKAMYVKIRMGMGYLIHMIIVQTLTIPTKKIQIEMVSVMLVIIAHTVPI
jgi:hypothetical protein